VKLKKGDKIVVTAGKDKGRNGTIEKVYPKKGKVLIPGINMYKKHVRKTEKDEGGIIEFAKPLPLSNIALLCPECGKQTRVGFTLVEDKKRRICKKCKKLI
jgi:large subunit ribosomal protein L24